MLPSCHQRCMDPSFRWDDGRGAWPSTHPRHRRRHDQHAGDAVRGRRGVPRAASSGSWRSIIRGPGWVEHDAEEIWAVEPRLRAGDGRAGGRRGADRRRSASPTSARRSSSGARRTGEALAPAIVWQDRRTADLCAALKEQGHEAGGAGEDRAAARPLFQREQDRLGAGELAAAARGGRRSVRRHGRELAGLQADRRAARHRRDQRLAHRADGHRTRAAGTRGCSTCSACRAARCPRSSTAPARYGETDPTCSARRSRSAAWPATSRRRRSARPASRPATPRRPTAPARSC